MSVFQAAIPLVENIKSPQGTVQTQEFLYICEQILPIVAKLGTFFGLVKSDVGGNIHRLANRASMQPTRYNADILDIVRDEVREGTYGDASSCTNGLLWLKRAMQFIVALLRRLDEDRAVTLSAAATETYYATLQQYHGWLVTGTFTVALKLVPGKEHFFKSVGAHGTDDETVMAPMREFCDKFDAVLSEIHKFLADNGLDDPTKV